MFLFKDCWKALQQMSSVQVAAVEALTAVVESQLVAGSDVVELLLPSVLANINVVGSPDEVCMQVLLESHDTSSHALQAKTEGCSPCTMHRSDTVACLTGRKRLVEVLSCHSTIVGQNTHQGQDLASGPGKGCQR